MIWNVSALSDHHGEQVVMIGFLGYSIGNISK